MTCSAESRVRDGSRECCPALRRRNDEDREIVEPAAVFPSPGSAVHALGSRTAAWGIFLGAGSSVLQCATDCEVDELYETDTEVASDKGLKAWIDASKDPNEGNVQLPDITTRALLVELLTSLLYRVTAHGAGSLTSVVNPALAFVSNFPPCLQSKEMPEPSVQLSDTELLARMPYTGTMGTMATFYFTFAYSEPYVPAIPKGGDNLDPYWPDPGTPSDEACNSALLQYRANIRSFVTMYTDKWNEELARIRGVPGPVPSYAENQAEQWPRSIEI